MSETLFGGKRHPVFAADVVNGSFSFYNFGLEIERRLVMKNMANPTPYDIEVTGGLSGRGHIVARSIAAKIVLLSRDQSGWHPFPLEYLYMRSYENRSVVNSFLELFISEGKVVITDDMISVTEVFIRDCALPRS